MPKSRRSNTTIASTNRRNPSNEMAIDSYNENTSGIGSIGGAGSVQDTGVSDENSNSEIVQRMQNRLNEVRTVRVNVESRTRARNEELEVSFDPDRSGIARVASPSGHTYEVNYVNGSCNCMHYRIHGDGCRHIDAANAAVGQISNERRLSGNNETVTAEALDRQSNIDAAEEMNRRNITIEQEDDGFFYEDNKSTFREMLQGNMEETPYEYDNVLNGSKITFGVELEFVGGNADAIAGELYDLGICAHDSRVGYHSPSVEGKWKLERDSSVSMGDGGGELVSPVLRDTPETWHNIQTICEVAKRHGASVNSHTGAHVHVGMEPLDTARQRWKRFFRVIGRYEESIYRFSGGDLGRIRDNYSHYAMPFADTAKNASNMRFRMNSPEDVNSLANTVGTTRYYGVNLTNIPYSSRPDTVEFRYFNGSLNAKQIQNNIMLANGVVMAAEKARTKDSENFNVTDSMKRRGEMLTSSVESPRRRDESSMRKFVDIVFTRKKDKDAAIEVFAKNTWR